MDVSNWINIGILAATLLAGFLSWLGARQSARKARKAQDQANFAAQRSAAAAEDAARAQARMLDLEQLRQADAALDVKRAKLHAEKTSREVHRFDKPAKDWYLTILNSGQSAARALQVLANGRQLGDYREFIDKLPPNASIGANGRLDLMIAFYMQGKLYPPFELTLTWDDDSGIRGQWAGTIT